MAKQSEDKKKNIKTKKVVKKSQTTKRNKSCKKNENTTKIKSDKNCAEKRAREETLKIAKEFTTDRDNLIAILNEIQQKYGYIPKESQLVISEYLSIPLAEVYGVITFYSRFTLIPKGKYNISICMGTACFVKGSKELLERAKKRLNIEEGQTSEDRKVFIRYNEMCWSMRTCTCIYSKQ